MKKLLFFLFAMCIFITGFSQGKIIMMSGKIIEGSNIKRGEEMISYTYEHKGEEKKNEIEFYRVFSIQYEDGKEEIVYEQDTAAGLKKTVEEMRYFIYGERDAQNNHKTPAVAIAGVVYGAVGGYFFAPVPIATPLIPISYTLAMMIPKTKVKPSRVSNPDYMKQEHYIKGFQRAGRVKRINKAILGSAGGTVLGVVTYFLVGS